MVSETGHFTAASLTFLPQPHEYRLPDGRVVPSVTQILKAVGVSTDFEEIAASRRSLSEQIEAKRRIGSVLHEDAHAYDDDDLDLSQVHQLVLPYLEAWAQVRVNLNLRPLIRERRVFHAALFYCGTLDGLFELPDGRVILADLKTGNPRDAAAHLQLAAYEGAYRNEHPKAKIDERWSVWLRPGRTIPYEITNYSARDGSWRDFQKFAACVTVFCEQALRRREGLCRGDL